LRAWTGSRPSRSWLSPRPPGFSSGHGFAVASSDLNGTPIAAALRPASPLLNARLFSTRARASARKSSSNPN